MPCRFPTKVWDMMARLLAMILVFSVGCGTILNSGPATIVPPPGATVDGVAGPIPASKKLPHEVVYPDGRRCIIESSVGDWKLLRADACPGVSINGSVARSVYPDHRSCRSLGGPS